MKSTTEQQDLAWKCLPVEARGKIRAIYTRHKDLFSNLRSEALKEVFGSHNITSDIEPEEMLMVSRKKVQELYKHFGFKHDPTDKENEFNRELIEAKESLLLYLFHNKCLSDQPIPKTETTTEPKFKVGDKVRVVDYDHSLGSPFHIQGKVCIISQVRVSGITKANIYKIELANDSDKFIRINACDTAEEFLKTILWDESFLEPYTEPEPKENKPMEEKELNLVELLKECNPKTLYSPAFGIITLKKIDTEDNKPLYWGAGFTDFYTYPDGRIYKDSQPTIYPSKELYEKYPLDPRKAWQEWSESRKPRYRLSEVNYIYKGDEIVDKIILPDFLFDSLEETQEAVNEIKALLEDWHKRKEGEP